MPEVPAPAPGRAPEREPPREPWVAGLLLAAGAGRRYGMPKALAHDGAWLRRSVAVLRDGGCTSVHVVLGARAAEARALVPDGASVVIAAAWARGMSVSLGAGLSAVGLTGADAVVLHLVDLPDVGADVVRRLVGTAVDTVVGPAPDAPTGGPGPARALRRAVARAAYHGRPGHPVLIGRDHWASMAASLSGDAGARTWLADRPDAVTVECGDLAEGRDVDAPGPQNGTSDTPLT